MEILNKRARIIRHIRDFFISREYLEVETPLRQPACIPEGHIEPVKSGDWFLQPSPEQSMKKLLADGYPKIFQICKCFRSGERGRLHLPEFTMLEWYRCGIDYQELMRECEELLASLEKVIEPPWTGEGDRPWPRITVTDLFQKHADLNPAEAVRQDRFEEILSERIEPNLGHSTPVFVYDYPAALGSLARLKPGDNKVAERFEVYLGGIELANGFSELVDSKAQRTRFQKEREDLREKGIEPGPVPEKFLEGLDRIPAAAGIALGIDRLVMVCCGLNTIDEAVAMLPEGN